MARVALLYIEDRNVAPHLDLIRKICEPRSRSRPHVTVRYFDRLAVPPEYSNTRFKSIDLLEPGRFDDGTTVGRATVFIRCWSDQLAQLEHKPDFPASEFHITLYDGGDPAFADGLLKVLREIDWGYRLRLRSKPTLSLVELGPEGRRTRTASEPYAEPTRRLFGELVGRPMEHSYLTELTPSERLDLCREVCLHLARVAAGLARTKSSVTDSIPIEPIENEVGFPSDVHLTPPELAQDMARLALAWLSPGRPIRFGDPAVGNGALYGALLQLAGKRQVESAIGVDVNPQQIAAARRRWAHRGLEVLRADYLHMERLEARNVVLANPPYLRHQLLPRQYKRSLRQRASVLMNLEVSAQAGLYIYFLLLAHSWMEAGGVACWLLPSNFMQTTYGKAVRTYLTQRVRLIRLHVFDQQDPQFENARVRPAVILFAKDSPRPDDRAVLTSGGTLASPDYSESVLIEELQSGERWRVPWPRNSAPSENQIRLGDLFQIHRGIATGANSEFIVTRDEAKRLGLPELALRPILPRAWALDADVIEADATGYPDLVPQWCLIDCDLSAEEIRREYPELSAYLARLDAAGVTRRHLVRKRKIWYRQEQRAAAPFLCTYMGRGRNGGPPLRFVWNRSRAVATNAYLMMYPRPELRAKLQTITAQRELYTALRKTARRMMSEWWRVHADGLYKIEPGDLAHVRLAEPPDWLDDLINPPSRALQLELVHRDT